MKMKDEWMKTFYPLMKGWARQHETNPLFL